MFDVKRSVGGINHFMLPVWNDAGLATPKYGNVAITKLVEKLVSLGSRKEDLIAKVFGGANSVMTTNIYEIGKRNVQVAFDTLAEQHIRVVNSDVGGARGRKIEFFTGTNIVKLRYV